MWSAVKAQVLWGNFSLPVLHFLIANFCHLIIRLRTEMVTVLKKKTLLSASELWLSGLSCLACCYLSGVVAWIALTS